MGYDLRGPQGWFGFNQTGWWSMCTLAQRFGWKPAGTETPKEWPKSAGPWSPNNYSTNDWQLLTAADALELAAALERALAAPPVTWDDRNDETPPTKEWVDHLRGFIVFCRQGGFTIG